MQILLGMVATKLHDNDLLEQLQYEAARLVTGARIEHLVKGCLMK